VSGKSVFGLTPNLAAALSYVVGFVTGIIVLVLEKDDKFVRFHALQSILVFGGLTVLRVVAPVLKIIPFFGEIAFGIVSLVLSLVGIVAWVYLIYTAYQGKTFKVPFVGDIASEQINK